MNLLFDLDGTLTDPKAGIVGCIRHALKGLGRDPDEYSNLERFIGPPLLDSFEELLGARSEAQAALALYRERFGSVGLYENEIYAGIDDCLEALHSDGFRLIVATSKPELFALQIIEHFGLSKYFDQVYGSELDGRRSDKSQLIKWILEKESLEKTETRMIGDRSFDMLGAKTNGIHALGVLWGYGSQKELTNAGADALFSSPSELKNSIMRVD